MIYIVYTYIYINCIYQSIYKKICTLLIVAYNYSTQLIRVLFTYIYLYGTMMCIYICVNSQGCLWLIWKCHFHWKTFFRHGKSTTVRHFFQLSERLTYLGIMAVWGFNLGLSWTPLNIPALWHGEYKGGGGFTCLPDTLRKFFRSDFSL